MIRQDGSALNASYEAGSQAALRERLEKEGFFILEIRRQQAAFSFFSAAASGSLRRLRLSDFYAFNQEFAVLVRAGMPIVAALDTMIEKEERTGVRNLITALRTDVATGESLSAAMAKHPTIFPSLYVAALKAGEKSGDISTALRRHIDYLKRVAATRRKVIAATIYPALLTVASVLVLVFLLAVVVPAFTGTYQESKTPLPVITQVVIAIGQAVRSHWLLIMALTAMLLAGFTHYRRSPGGRLYLDRLMLRLPLIGVLQHRYATALSARTLATVLASGTPLTEAISIAAGSQPNAELHHRMVRVQQRLEEGGAFSEALQETQLMPTLAAKIVAAGERSGALAGVLTEVADFYDAEVESRVTMLASIIEPTLMILMGLLIGFVVLAMYLPIFQLAATIS
jgi:type IV pilus assembly protein PilC